MYVSMLLFPIYLNQLNGQTRNLNKRDLFWTYIIFPNALILVYVFTAAFISQNIDLYYI